MMIMSGRDQLRQQKQKKDTFLPTKLTLDSLLLRCAVVFSAGWSTRLTAEA